jgi:hypothetical protein
MALEPFQGHDPSPIDTGDGNGNRGLPAFILGLLILMILARYGGIPDHYAYAYAMANQPWLLPFDHILNGSVFLKASVFFDLNSFLRIEENEIVLVGLYLAVSVFNLAVAYIILRRHVAADRVTALALLLVLAFVDRKINTNAWSLLFAAHPGSSSMLGNPLALLTIHFLLERRFPLAYLAMTGVFLFQVKENSILIPASLLFIAFLGRRNWWQAGFVLVPLGFLMFKSATGFQYHLPYDEMVEVVRRNLLQETRDGSFLLHTPAANLLLLAVIAASVWLSFRLDENLRRLVQAFALATLVFQAANIAYLAWLWPLRPDPKLIMLGAVRNSRFIIFFFFLAASWWIALRSPLRSHEKAAAILALLLVHGESWKGAIYPLVVLVGGIVLPRLAATLAANDALHRRASAYSWQVWLAVTLGLYGCGQAAAGGVYGTIINPLAYEYTGRFSIGAPIDRSGWESLRRLRAIDGGGPLLFVYHDANGRVMTSGDAVTFARKAAFNPMIFSGLSSKPDRAFYAEVDSRHAAIANLLDDLGAGRAVADATLAFLASRGLWLVVPKGLDHLIASYGRPEELDGHVLRRPTTLPEERP